MNPAELIRMLAGRRAVAILAELGKGGRRYQDDPGKLVS